MRIAVWHNLPSGGGKRALYDQVKGLVERGHTVECWCPAMADRAYLPLQELAPEHIVPFDYAPRKLPGKAGRAANRYLNAIGRMRAMDKACKQSAREIEAGGFDLLFANGCLLYYMPYIVRYVRGPKVVYLQEPCRAFYEARPALPWVGRVDGKEVSWFKRMGRSIGDQMQLQAIRMQARKEWVAAHAVDRILVNSYYSRETILRTYGREATVCYLGVDTSLFCNQHRPRERFILGLGSFTPAKGIELAIRSIALLPEPRPPLVWVGNGGVPDYEQAMKQLAASCGVRYEPRLLITDAELVETLNRAALLVYASRLEPFGYAPLEANACGAPVVAVAEGGVRETVKDGGNGFLVDGEPAAMAAAIARLLNDAELAQTLGERGCEAVHQAWSVEKSIDRLEENLLQVAGLRGEA